MALPTSGPLSLLDIANELQVTNQNVSLDNLGSLAGFSNPVAVSDFYGFSACSCIEVICTSRSDCDITVSVCGGGSFNTTIRSATSAVFCTDAPILNTTGTITQGPGTGCRDC